MAEAVYAIDDFPDDDLLWRIEWIGGVGYNTSVPSDPQIDVCLAQLPAGETNPLSARSRSSQTKENGEDRRWSAALHLDRFGLAAASAGDNGSRCLAAIGCASIRHRVEWWRWRDLTANAIPRSSYLFGASWPDVRRTLLVAVEQDGDPYAVMVPTAEIIRFYYAPSTRLAQALFWGEYNDTFNAERSGVFEEGVVKVHLRRWLEDQDAWTLARYICSPVMQREASKLYKSLQLYQTQLHQFDLGTGSSPPVRFSVRRSDNGSRHISSFARTDTGQPAALADPSN